MKILILGGTEFLGRYLVIDALDRGHEVTLFNRGKTNPHLFPEVEKISGDRAQDLDKLKGRNWDVTIDTCGYSSGPVRSSASLLSYVVEHYTYVSSISVYRDFSVIALDESGPLEELPVGNTEDENDHDSYGARKVLCERAAEQSMPGRVLSVRAGIIVGPNAGIDRFPYWIRRIASGGKVLAPGPPDRAVQLIDVRDLASWMLTMAQNRVTGIFNATGPETLLTFEQMLHSCRAATNSDAEVIWMSEDFLLQHGVKPFSELPFWLPGPPFAGLFRLDCTKAIAHGLTFRSLIDTARDTISWDRQRDRSNEPPIRANVLAEGQIGLAPEREKLLLAEWLTH